MSEVKNIYKDEQEKIDNDTQVEIELSFKLQELLDRYGYDLIAEMEDGLPAVKLIKLS